MFRNSTQRKDEDYVDYNWEQEGEVATQYYPNWRIIRWPRTYSVPKSRTSCNKKYPGSKGFSFGLFTVGCGCSRNITLGFELMKNKETAHNLFRLITCRNIDMNKLKAICFDHACSLHAYAMNREAREFEYVKIIVDTLHWKNHTACSWEGILLCQELKRFH